MKLYQKTKHFIFENALKISRHFVQGRWVKYYYQPARWNRVAPLIRLMVCSLFGIELLLVGLLRKKSSDFQTKYRQFNYIRSIWCRPFFISISICKHVYMSPITITWYIDLLDYRQCQLVSHSPAFGALVCIERKLFVKFSIAILRIQNPAFRIPDYEKDRLRRTETIFREHRIST